MPGAGVHCGANRPTARAKARYGSAVRSTASRGAAASSRSSTAEAPVVASAGRYFELATNVRSPGPASSMPATRTISISLSPSRRQESRSASSRNFIRNQSDGPRRHGAHGAHGGQEFSVFFVPSWFVTARISRASHGNPFEERREVLQSQLLLDLAHTPAARIAVEQRGFAQLRERFTRSSRPRDAVQPLEGAANREPMAHHTK